MNRWITKVGVYDLVVEDGKVQSLLTADETVDYPSIDDSLSSDLDRFIDGDGVSIAIDLSGVTSPIQQLTLAKLMEIPRGEVRPYSWVAREIGQPRAIRAVASAVARNPVALLVPCHRVVRSDGLIGEYSLGGPEAKRRFLEYEGLNVDEMEARARRGVRFLGSSSDKTFHYPTCRRVRDDREVVEFKNVSDAESAEFAACERCRPF